jgi:hypothetical protein
MTPGPTIIRKCTACTKPIKQHTIGSGNTFGATFWTDGKREAPMLPDQPWMVICPHCHSPLWIDELETLGEIEPWGEGRGKFKEAIEYGTPTLDDYLTALGKDADTPEKERYVRLRAWWASNDVRRKTTGDIPLSSLETANLTAFANMFDEADSNDLVMKAEVMRELGRFDVAMALLARSADSDIAQAVEIIKRLVESKDPYVREMHFK